jgi:DNA polymerase-3 subunit epsilon/CBS domain-containing protein
VTRSKPADLLSVDIFFDLAAVHGDARLAVEIWRDGFEFARDNAAFAKLLAEASGGVTESITMFGGIRTNHGRIDLKKAGLFGSSPRRACWRFAIIFSSARRRRD